MKTIDDIVAAARKLSQAQFLRLREKLDQLEKKTWAIELARTTAELRAENLTEAKIDHLVMRRRRESRR